VRHFAEHQRAAGRHDGTLRCDHPDIEEYIDAKRGGGALASFNLSVQVSDEFMAAVAADRDFALAFPADGLADGEAGRPGRDAGVDGQQ